ncbi:uncharacterized protein HMPREF1541_04329 [Cyphellophora europaea CBS 101466]|uniref:Uncharacterized protein n=1 Tax=Cyphellophora europaea (strain CBS 101466) TaxID=1220924 RepID=W2RWI7_CYPE1|nr:uncharacterized protein HMPREF1541_04329 [Cyphellophora europaea CBS 101466]ETN40054.1 hypothetical protein HMPREF1541_04329 [Cyphellophora europaea CBS 101466]
MKSVIALALAGVAVAVPAWSDAPVEPIQSTTTTAASSTWADVEISTTTTKPVVPTTSATSTWGDWSSETTSTVTAITTVCQYATTFTDKGDVYTATAGETYVLTKGPYTVTIPVYEETSTVCDTPVAPTGAASTWVDAVVPAGPTGASTGVSPASPSAGYPGKPAGSEPVSPYTGAASKMAGAGLAGVAAIAALLL